MHQPASPVLICNVWDVVSARTAQHLQYQAIGTSSGAIADMLGYPDGEAITFGEMAYVVQRIIQATDLPLSVDLEAGYSRDPNQIADHIQQLVEIGVVGVNLEDSLVTTTRSRVDPHAFAATLESICSLLARKNLEVFINVRTDTFLLREPDPVAATIACAQLYRDAGGQGLFVPCIEKAADIAAVIDGIDLPLNVMCMPKLPDFATLAQLGVSRISMGNFVHNRMTTILEQELGAIIRQRSFQSLFV